MPEFSVKSQAWRLAPRTLALLRCRVVGASIGITVQHIQAHLEFQSNRKSPQEQGGQFLKYMWKSNQYNFLMGMKRNISAHIGHPQEEHRHTLSTCSRHMIINFPSSPTALPLCIAPSFLLFLREQRFYSMSIS